MTNFPVEIPTTDWTCFPAWDWATCHKEQAATDESRAALVLFCMRRQIEVTSHTANLGKIRRLVRESLSQTALDAEALDLVVLGIDEACSNVIRHAYALRDDAPIKLSLEIGPDGLRCCIRDFGKHPCLKAVEGRELKELRPGGLGVHLIRRVFDRVDYQLMPQGTELRLFKKL